MRIVAFRLAILSIAVFASSVSLNAQGQVVSPWSETPVGSDTPSGKRIMAKLNAIIIDKLNFERQDLRLILSFLTKRSKELDPEHVGVKFILRGPYQPPVWDGHHREVTQSFADVPLIELLWYICHDTDHDFKIEDDAVIVFPAVHKGQNDP